MEEKYTIEDVARLLRVTRPTVMREISDRKLGYIVIGKRKFILQSQLDAYLLKIAVPATNK